MNSKTICFACCAAMLTVNIGNSSEQCGRMTNSTSVCNSIATNLTRSVGFSTWYSRKSCRHEGTGGKNILMANGKLLDDSAMTCAIWNIPFGRKLRVRNLDNGRTVIVTVTDRGPGKRSRSRGVIVDLTEAAMRELAGEEGIKQGRVRVELEDA